MLVVMHECVNFLYIGLKNSKILYNVDKYVNQLLEVRTMKKMLAVLLVTAVAVCTTCVASFADGKSLQDVINANSGTEQTTGVTQDNTQAAQPTQPTQPTQPEQSTQHAQPTQPDANTGAGTSGAQDSKDDTLVVKENSSDKFIDDLGKVSDLTTPDVAGVKTATTGIRLVAAFIVQVLSYFITAFLAVRVVLDLCYVTIPFTRSFLGNGYQGTPQSAGNMTPGGMGMGMNRMGGYGGGYGGGYNRYGGMGAGMGMGTGIGAGMGAGMGMGMQNTMSNNANNVIGNIQFVSNAALNAAASESAIGPDGKSQSPIKVYFKDMAVTLVVTPILVLLAATGVLTQFGLLLGNYIGAAIEKIGSMI